MILEDTTLPDADSPEAGGEDPGGEDPGREPAAPPSGPPSAARAGKRRRFWRTAFFALAIAGIMAAAAWTLFGSRLLAVRSVTVTGTRLVPRSEVLAVAGVQPGTPLILLNTGQIAARVDTIRQVRSARVSRSWPDRVVIAVRERTPAVAVAAPGGGYNLLDVSGVAVRWTAVRPQDLPLYVPPAAGVSPHGDPDVAAAVAVFGNLPPQLRRSVYSVSAPSPDQVTLRLRGGPWGNRGATVLWGGPGEVAAKMRELNVLMLTRARYYDVSAQGSVMTK